MVQAQCTASFTTSVSGSTATFTSTSTPPTATYNYITYNWVYGDGNTGGAFSHTYASSGNYTVCLRVTYNDSTLWPASTVVCTDSTCNTITVGTPPPPPNQITGSVGLDSAATNNPSSPNFIVWLIKYDASSNLLSAIDSVPLTYPTNSFVFNNEPAGTYRVKTALTNGPTSGTASVPTYGYDSLYWNNCDSFAYSGTGVSGGHSIYMQTGTVTAGAGFVGGNVTLGANKGTKTTNGQPGVEILIRNATHTIAYQMTDASGNFSFSNLPVPGTYTIYPEVLGYQNTPWTVTLTPAAPSASSANFHIATSTKTTHPVTTGISNTELAQNSIKVYPNPTTGLVNITSAETATAIVSDVVGRQVMETEVKAGNTQLNISSLKAGVYFINIKSADLNYSSKIILQH